MKVGDQAASILGKGVRYSLKSCLLTIIPSGFKKEEPGIVPPAMICSQFAILAIKEAIKTLTAEEQVAYFIRGVVDSAGTTRDTMASTSATGVLTSCLAAHEQCRTAEKSCMTSERGIPDQTPVFLDEDFLSASAEQIALAEAYARRIHNIANTVTTVETAADIVLTTPERLFERLLEYTAAAALETSGDLSRALSRLQSTQVNTRSRTNTVPPAQVRTGSRITPAAEETPHPPRNTQ